MHRETVQRYKTVRNPWKEKYEADADTNETFAIRTKIVRSSSEFINSSGFLRAISFGLVDLIIISNHTNILLSLRYKSNSFQPNNQPL